MANLPEILSGTLSVLNRGGIWRGRGGGIGWTGCYQGIRWRRLSRRCATCSRLIKTERLHLLGQLLLDSWAVLYNHWLSATRRWHATYLETHQQIKNKVIKIYICWILTGLVPLCWRDDELYEGATAGGRDGSPGAGDIRFKYGGCTTLHGTWGGGGGGVFLGGGGGGGSLKLGEYRLTCNKKYVYAILSKKACATLTVEWISVRRGLSDRELPAPLSNAGLLRGNASSRSMLGFRISLEKLLGLAPPPVPSSGCFRKSRAMSSRPLANWSALVDES